MLDHTRIILNNLKLNPGSYHYNLVLAFDILNEHLTQDRVIKWVMVNYKPTRNYFASAIRRRWGLYKDEYLPLMSARFIDLDCSDYPFTLDERLTPFEYLWMMDNLRNLKYRKLIKKDFDINKLI